MKHDPALATFLTQAAFSVHSLAQERSASIADLPLGTTTGDVLARIVQREADALMAGALALAALARDVHAGRAEPEDDDARADYLHRALDAARRAAQ